MTLLPCSKIPAVMHHRTLTIASPLIAFALSMASCSAQTPSSPADARNDPAAEQALAPVDTAQLSAYIVAALEDSKGNLWFGTVGDGVIRYSPTPSVVPGERLSYFTTEDGLADMVSEQIWQRMGAEEDGYITVDSIGVPFGGGGMSASLRDLARFGELMRSINAWT